MDSKIDIINLQLTKFKTHALYHKLEVQLRERFDKFNKDTLIKKDKKFFRDKKHSKTNVRIGGLLDIQYRTLNLRSLNVLVLK